MTDTTFIPDYLKPALERLAAAREAHLEQACRMEDTLTAITRAEEQKAALEQDNGSDTRTWRAAFRAGGAMLTEKRPYRASGPPGAGAGMPQPDRSAGL